MTALLTIPLQSPGSLGLSTEDQDTVLDPRYATVLDNCILSRNGRLESRKGYSKLNSAAATGTPDLDVVHSYVTNSGSEILLSTGGNLIWSGDTALTDVIAAGTVAGSITADNWQFQNFAGNTIAVQASHEPLWWDGSGTFEYLVDQNELWSVGAGTARTLGDVVIPAARNGLYYECTTTGTSDAAELDSGAWAWSTTVGGTTTETGGVVWTTREIQSGNAALSAFGRLWVISPDATTVYYSDLLIPSAFSGGSSGFIDLNTVWPKSNDTIVALAVHNNNLIILCEKSVVVYTNIDNIDNIYLVEVVSGIGCAARDSVQNIGEDVLWLSREGIRTLSRTVLQDNMPLNTLSSKVRTEIVATIEQEVGDVRSTYNEPLGLYIINFPTSKLMYVFDIRSIQQGQTVRPFIWNSINPLGLCTRLNSDLIFGLEGGFLGLYGTNLDDASTYIMKYRSGWIDPGSQGMEMIWKAMRVYLAASYDFDSTGTWTYDFNLSDASEVRSVLGGSTSEYNIAEYNIDEYGSGSSSNELNFNLTGTGELIKIGFQAVINAGSVGINKITLKAKKGKIN